MTSFLMLAHEYITLYRIPVGVYIERRHEDRHLQFLLVEILVLFRRLYHHHTAVRGSNNEIRIIDLQHAHRVAGEISYKH